jgi:hypothetical protein
MLAMAYNQGAGNAVSYASGASIDSQVRMNLSNYKSGIDQNWGQADKVICQSGAFTCTG